MAWLPLKYLLCPFKVALTLHYFSSRNYDMQPAACGMFECYKNININMPDVALFIC